MLRYTTDRHGLVAFYDIQPGNGAGLYNPRAHTGSSTLRDPVQDITEKYQ